MAAAYPTSAKSFTTKTDGSGQTVFAAHINDLQDEVVAMESALITNGVVHGLKPSVAGAQDLGTTSLPWGTVRARALNFDAVSALTISGGIVTATRSHHSIDTEGAAGTDDLDTITATGLTDGFVIVLRPADVTHVVTLKDGTGNLLLNGDYAMSATDRTITLLFDGTNWREVCRSVSTATVNVLDRKTALTDVVSTNAETDAYTFSVPGATLLTNRTLRLTFIGDYLNNSGGASNLTIKTTYGSTTIFSVLATMAASATRDPIQGVVHLMAFGATNAQKASGDVRVHTNAGGVSGTGLVQSASMSIYSGIHNSVAEDSTGALNLKVTITHSVNAATVSGRILTALLEVL